MNVFTGTALAGFQPAFGSKCVRIIAIFFHVAGDNGGKDHLNALGNGVATYDGILLKGSSITDHRAVHSANCNWDVSENNAESRPSIFT